MASTGGQDSLAERSKAVAQGAIPKGRGLEPHSCHFTLAHCACMDTVTTDECEAGFRQRACADNSDSDEHVVMSNAP